MGCDQQHRFIIRKITDLETKIDKKINEILRKQEEFTVMCTLYNASINQSVIMTQVQGILKKLLQDIDCNKFHLARTFDLMNKRIEIIERHLEIGIDSLKN